MSCDNSDSDYPSDDDEDFVFLKDQATADLYVQLSDRNSIHFDTIALALLEELCKIDFEEDKKARWLMIMR
jgi:hypothetical protein